MGNSARVVPTEVIPDSSERILDYLVRRTSDTVGKQTDRAEAIIVGEVKETGGRSLGVQVEDVSALRNWFSGEVSLIPKIMVYQTRVRVEVWLKGPGEPDTIEIVYVPRWKSHDSEILPLFAADDRGLIYLRKMAKGLPYASYVPGQSYQLAPGETGIHRFQVTDYDDQGHAHTRNDMAAVSEAVAAVRWYLALPPDNPERRRKALLDALRNRNTQIVDHAIRELAETSAPGAAERFKNMVPAAMGDLRVQLMLGLWVIGEREVALQILGYEFREGKDTWLGRWGLQPSLTETGEHSDTLFGPAASEKAR